MNTLRIAGMTGLLWAGAALAHGPVAREADVMAGQARLFTADSTNGNVVAVDLPSGSVVTRLATPPHVLTMGRTRDGRYLFAMRGRNTDRDTISVIDTGVDPDSEALRAPYIARTFMGSAPGGVRDGYLSTVAGREAVFQEGVGEIEIFESHEFDSRDAVGTRRIKLAAPDHYHYLEAGTHLYVGHLAKSMVQIVDASTGVEVGRIQKCPILHGMGRDDESGRLFFACMQNVVVVGTRGDEADQELGRIPYPGKQRVARFIRGKGRILWGYGEGVLPSLYRFDPAKEPYAFETLEVESAIQQSTSEDGNYLLVYSRSGTLDIRDGGSGELLRQVEISKPFAKEYHEHVDKAILPDIGTLGSKAYISVPPEGVVVEVDLEAGQLLRRIAVGGEPSRVIIVEAKAPAKPEAAAATN